jgi:low affinity Fe/Cu permease
LTAPVADGVTRRAAWVQHGFQENTQNRDSEALQIKIDELIRATKGAHNALLDLEELEQDNLDDFRRRYRLLACAARKDLERGDQDTGSPEA